MLRDRYAPQDLFALVPSASLALDPVLAQLDTLLDDDDLYQRVRADLSKRRTRAHRPAMTLRDSPARFVDCSSVFLLTAGNSAPAGVWE